MPDIKANPGAGSFIPRELRPAIYPISEDHPSLEPGIPREELARRANELLGGALRAQLHAQGGAGLLPGTVFGRSPHVVFTPVEGEAVLLHLRSGVYYSLNQVGTAVWNLLADQRPLERVCAALCQRFNVSADDAWSDLTALVGELSREQLVVETKL